MLRLLRTTALASYRGLTTTLPHPVPHSERGSCLGNSRDEFLAFASIHDISEKLRSGDVTTADVVAVARHRAEFFHGYKFFHEDDRVFTPLVEVQALIAQQLLSNTSQKPPSTLCGVVGHYKDLVSLDKARYTFGNRLFNDMSLLADSTHALVAASLSAGSLLLGAPAIAHYGYAPYSCNLIAGSTRNPHNPDRTSGGSSGGAASAVAAGVGSFALVNDDAGSVRIPASFTGTVGFKAPMFMSEQRWKSSGVTTSAGVITRSVEDLAHVLSGLEPKLFQGALLPALRNMPGNTLRVAFMPTLGFAPDVLHVDERIAKLVATAAQIALPRTGIQVDLLDVGQDLLRDIAQPDIFEAAKIRWFTQLATGITQVTSMYRNEVPGGDARRLVAPELLDIVVPDGLELASQVGRGRAIECRVVRALEKIFSQYDAIITPTMPILPWQYGQCLPFDPYKTPTTEFFKANPFTFAFNWSGHAAMSVPIGFVDDLPVGLQIVAGPGATSLAGLRPDFWNHVQSVKQLLYLGQALALPHEDTRPVFNELRHDYSSDLRKK